MFANFFAQFKRANRDAKKIRQASDILERYGLTALCWLDRAKADVDRLEHAGMDLFLAVKTLREFGFVIVDREGVLIGEVVKLTETRDDIAQRRRSSFRLVEIK